MPEPLKFKPKTAGDFSKTLKAKVSEYFRKSNKTIYANEAMIVRTLIMLSFWIGLYLLLILANLGVACNLLIWISLGVSIALVTINVGHDAIHGAYSKNKTVNGLLAHTFNLNGASAYMWKRMHNIAHHSYTNIHGYDEDISPAGIIRVAPSTPRRSFHKYQHFYSFLLYCLGTLSWIFIKDYVKFFKNEVGNYSNKKHQFKEYFFLFFYKICCYTIFLVIPLLVIKQPWFYVILGFVLMHMVAGFYLAMVFAVAHEVELVSFPLPDNKGNVEYEWLIHQLHTTANFSAGNRVAAILTGGLNQQVEHHLFPNICSVHYPALSRIVKETAQEFELPYYNFPSFLGAVKSHIAFLKKLGSE